MNNVLIYRLKWILLIQFMVFAGTIQAASYYVDQKHPAASDQNAGSIYRPWKTIAKANQTLTAGDTVFIRAGKYHSYIAPVNSGNPGFPVVFTNYGTEKVTVSDTSYGIYLNAKSFISVSGIDFYNLDRFMYLQNGANYNVIAYCNFDQARMVDGKTAAWPGSVINKNSKYNRIHHCRFSKYGYFTDDDRSCILDIGDEKVRTDSTSHNLIENCTFFHGGHHILGVFGMYNVIRNSYFHNEPWAMGTPESDRGAVLYGDRNVYVSGFVETAGRNLFEGNQIGYASDPSDDIGATGMTLTTSNNIVRFNRFYYNDVAGLTMCVFKGYCQDIVYNKIYHNTFLHNSINEISSKCAIAIGIYNADFIIKYNSIRNNLFFGHERPFGTYKVYLKDRDKANIEDQFFAGNWDGDSLGDPLFVNASESFGDPMDSGYPDLRLRPGTPCKDKATYLTTIVSPAGKGNSFTVADAGYFMDGWGIEGISGDEIQLYQTSHRARIVSVNYTTNLITLDKEVTWTSNQGVSLVYEGDAPDPGAFEYQVN